jgi:hypothetical protein
VNPLKKTKSGHEGFFWKISEASWPFLFGLNENTSIWMAAGLKNRFGTVFDISRFYALRGNA